MIPIRVSRNDNELNECAHCGREYALDDTPVVCIDECPGYDRTDETTAWQIEQWVQHMRDLALAGDDYRNEMAETADRIVELAQQAGQYEYTQDHINTALVIMEHLKNAPASAERGKYYAALGGSAEVREHVAKVGRELETQFDAIGLQWDEDADWYSLCERVAAAIVLDPHAEPAQLVRVVLNNECRIVFRPPT